MTNTTNTPAAARSTGKRTNKSGTAGKSKRSPRSTKVKDEAGNTFTTVEYAAEHDLNPKSMRQRIRNNIKAGKTKWLDIMVPVDGKSPSYLFKDNVATRKAIAALLDA